MYLYIEMNQYIYIYIQRVNYNEDANIKPWFWPYCTHDFPSQYLFFAKDYASGSLLLHCNLVQHLVELNIYIYIYIYNYVNVYVYEYLYI